MDYLVFDIETIGKKFDEFDDTSKEIFRGWAERDSKTETDTEKEMDQIKKGLPLSPFLGEVVAISMIDNGDKGATYFRADDDPSIKDFEEDGIQYRVGSEKETLQRFWDVAINYRSFVTFNGRGFDVPYIMIRSAVHGIRIPINMMSNRYLGMQRGSKHVDLSDQMTFYGAIWKKPKLHFVTQAFGIESPKGGGISGEDVPQAFWDKRYVEIAKYCMADVRATKELMEKWDEYLSFD